MDKNSTINLNYNSLVLDLENLRDLYNRQNYLIAVYDSENRELKEKIKELEQRNDYFKQCSCIWLA